MEVQCAGHGGRVALLLHVGQCGLLHESARDQLLDRLEERREPLLSLSTDHVNLEKNVLRVEWS